MLRHGAQGGIKEKLPEEGDSLVEHGWWFNTKSCKLVLQVQLLLLRE